MLGPELRFVERTKVIFDGKKYLFFGGNDYHRLSNHPEVVRAFCEAARSEGLNSAGSRITTGNHPLYVTLEDELAGFFGTEASVVLPSGYLGNLVILQAVGRDFQRFFIDEAAHSSVTDAAAILPRDAVHRFRRGDPDDLEAVLRSHLKGGERPLVLADGVFAGTGGLAPLGAYGRITEGCGGMLLVDDAHGVAVVGRTGRGSIEEAGLPEGAAFRTGTLSKGFGAFGGVIPGPRALIEQIRERSRAFVGSTGMSVPLAAAGIKAVEILRGHPEMISSLRARVLQVKEKVRGMGFKVPDSPAPIFSIRFSDEARTEHLRAVLLREGVYPPLIHYPGSPPGGHFRFTLSSAHTDDDIETLLGALEVAG